MRMTQQILLISGVALYSLPFALDPLLSAETTSDGTVVRLALLMSTLPSAVILVTVAAILAFQDLRAMRKSRKY